MRTRMIAGNWKMNTTLSEAKNLAQSLTTISSLQTEVVIFPPFISLETVRTSIQNSQIKLGAQTLHHEEKGAYTGEISGPMLKSVGCEYVLIGHSERRQYFNEDNALLNKKIRAAISHQIIPILCVGESLAERENNTTLDVIKTQLLETLTDIPYTNMIIAYEPVWAIGTGKVATPEQAQEVHAFIRGTLSEHYDQISAEKIRILYGGSVTPQNSPSLFEKPDIDGALVGGASLSTESFINIIQTH